MQDLVNPSVTQNSSVFADKFRSARPFRYVVIDDFLRPEVAEALLTHFPAVTDPSKLLSEFGEPNPKSACSKIRELGGIYSDMDSFIQTPTFLNLMSEITGIPDLKYDPYYYGGGTHENFHTAGLDPHYDFNIHPVTAQHRRINAIVYLNKDWDPAWKGSICFHSDPWDLKNDKVTEIQTAFNRCAIFETTERSWHSVPSVNLPPDKRHLSRKSFTVYLYTNERPAEEAAPEHGTVYVQTSIPKHIQAGHVLTQEDVDEIYANLERRNSYLRNLYKREYRFSEHIDRQKRHIRELERATHVPILGYAEVVNVQKALFPDRFMGSNLDLMMDVLRPATSVRLFGYRPENFDGSLEITLTVGESTNTHSVGVGIFEICQEFQNPIMGRNRLRISANKTQRGSSGVDERDLSCIINQIELVH